MPTAPPSPPGIRTPADAETLALPREMTELGVWNPQPRSPRSFELRRGPREGTASPPRTPPPGQLREGPGLPTLSSAPAMSQPLPEPKTRYGGKTSRAKGSAPERVQEWQEGQPIMMEAEHYIITLGSHWLGSRPSGLRGRTVAMGLGAPGCQSLGARLAEKAHVGQNAGQTEVQALSRGEAGCRQASASSRARGEGSCSNILPHCHHFRELPGPPSAPPSPHSSTSAHSPT